MAKIRDILIHVKVSGAIRDRKCHRNSQHHVKAGELFLLVQESQSLGSKNYCKECATEILSLAKSRLDEITRKLL